MAHFEVPKSEHSIVRDGTTFVWNTTDGSIGTISSYRFQVGTYANQYDVYNGLWKAGGPPGRYTDNVLNLTGAGTLYVRAQYKRNGQTYRTSPVPFSCKR
jgi:hypothetical protein